MGYNSSVPQGFSPEIETTLDKGTKTFLVQTRAASNLIYLAKATITTASTNVLTNAFLGVAMQANSRLTIDATIQGVRSDGLAYGTYKLNASFFRASTGAAIQLGATTVIYSRESNAALDAQLDISNSSPRVRVNDGAQGTIVWEVFIQGFSL